MALKNGPNNPSCTHSTSHTLTSGTVTLCLLSWIERCIIKQYKCGVSCSVCVKLLVHESQSCAQSDSWSLWTTVFYVNANAAVVLHFILMMQTHLLASCLKWNLLPETLCISVNFCHVWNRHIRKLPCEFIMTLLVETVFSMYIIQKHTHCSNGISIISADDVKRCDSLSPMTQA